MVLAEWPEVSPLVALPTAHPQLKLVWVLADCAQIQPFLDYTPRAYWWEPFEMLRKLTLTGAVLLIVGRVGVKPTRSNPYQLGLTW